MKRDWNYRRHHALRKQRHAYRTITQCWNIHDEKDAQDMARRLRDNLAVCSCPMCCNPRHSKLLKHKDKLTQQEQKIQIQPLLFESDRLLTC